MIITTIIVVLSLSIAWALGVAMGMVEESKRNDEVYRIYYQIFKDQELQSRRLRKLIETLKNKYEEKEKINKETEREVGEEVTDGIGEEK